MRIVYLSTIALITHVAIAQQSPSFQVLEYKFRDAPEWPLRSGRVLDVQYEGRKEHGRVTTIQENGTILFQIEYPEVVHQIIASEQRESLLVLVFRQRESGGGADYAYLLTAREKQDGTVEFQKRLPDEVPPMRKHQFVSELGAISDDASVALIKMGEPDREQPPYKVGYVWETWNLSSPKLLKTGLKLCD